jgi:MATE family multidrug resistance protein
MTVVDTWFVSQLGQGALAGTGFAGLCAFILICFPMGLTRAVKTLISQAIGAGRGEQRHGYLSAGLFAAAGQAVVVVTLGELLAEPLSRICATAEAAESARTYLSIRLLGTVAVLCGGVVQETRVALGDSRGPMRAALIANTFHVALAYVLIWKLHWGVAGAAWATVASQTLEASLMVVAQRSDGFQLRAARAQHFIALWSLGWPTAVQFVLEVGSFGLLAAMLASWSEVDMAAHQIALQIQHFAFLPSLAVGEANAVLAARAVGARKPELVLPLALRTLWVVGAYSSLCTLVLAFGSTPIVALFTSEAELGRLTRHLLHVACLFMFADACNIIARCTLRGTGDVRAAAVIGISTAWLLTPPLAYLLGRVLGWGVIGAWLGLTAEIVMGALLLWRRVVRGAWRVESEPDHPEPAQATARVATV